MSILIRKSVEFVQKNGDKPETYNHLLFLNNPKGTDAGLKKMFEGLEQYIEAYLENSQEDSYTEEYIENIMFALKRLLDYPGSFNKDILYSVLYELGLKSGIEFD